MVIEVFKAGTWTDSSGNTKIWTEEDLEKIVNTYNSQKEHEAPVVIGHPKDNAPAYGWVEKLEKKGNSIFAKIKPTVSEFIDWIKQGLYKKVSISLYPDMLLRHIGFLGAVPPAVKGLKAPEFSDGDFVEITFREWTKTEREKLAKGEIKGGFAGPDNTFPIASPEDVRDAWLLAGHSENPDEVRRNIINIAKNFGWVKALPKSAFEWAQKHNIELLEGGKMDTKILELEQKLKEKEEKISELQKKEMEFEEIKKELEIVKLELEKERKAMRQKEFENFIDSLIAEGKLFPAQKTVVSDFLEILHNVQEYSFSEGGNKKPVDVFKEFLTLLPKRLEFSDYATKDKGCDGIQKKDFKDMTGWELIQLYRENPEEFKKLVKI